MTVGELKEIIKDLSDETPVMGYNDGNGNLCGILPWTTLASESLSPEQRANLNENAVVLVISLD